MNLEAKSIYSMLLIITSIYFGYTFGLSADESIRNFYIFNPRESDSCELLQDKLNLFHPNGTNPIKFDLINMMKNKNCNITKENTSGILGITEYRDGVVK